MSPIRSHRWPGRRCVASSWARGRSVTSHNVASGRTSSHFSRSRWLRTSSGETRWDGTGRAGTGLLGEMLGFSVRPEAVVTGLWLPFSLSWSRSEPVQRRRGGQTRCQRSEIENAGLLSSARTSPSRGRGQGTSTAWVDVWVNDVTGVDPRDRDESSPSSSRSTARLGTLNRPLIITTGSGKSPRSIDR